MGRGQERGQGRESLSTTFPPGTRMREASLGTGSGLSRPTGSRRGGRTRERELWSLLEKEKVGVSQNVGLNLWREDGTSGGVQSGRIGKHF